MSTSVPSQAHARLEYLLGEDNRQWNGIDYVEVEVDADNRTRLRVHFLTTVPVAPAGPAAALDVTITGGETIGTVTVLRIDPAEAWSVDADGRWVLSLTVSGAGDASTYTLTIGNAPALDPYFDRITFRFDPHGPSDFDCVTPEPPPSRSTSDVEPAAIDYLAKDFAAFTRALSDFSALRYPDWVERSQADVGVMLMEALSAVADELSYYQDRVAGEATLATATQRVSLVRHARLVDYEPAAATAATAILQLEVGSTTPVAAGLRCSALGADGTQIPFEVGNGLAGPAADTSSFPVNPAWNAGRSGARNLLPYWWDESQQCLPAGAATIWLLGTGHQLEPGQRLLIDTAGPTSADPPVREVVTIASQHQDLPPVVLETSDPVFPQPLTRVQLAAGTSLPHDLGLTHLAGNLVPAVQGARTSQTFRIPVFRGLATAAPPGTPPPAVVRRGANWTAQDPVPDYRFTLAAARLCWLAVAPAAPDTSGAVDVVPQIVLSASGPALASSSASGGAGAERWAWQRWLLGCGAQDTVFTLTPEGYSRVGASGDATWYDYDGDGVTIHFGDGTFGLIPARGMVFTATYLVGGGLVGNVPADTIVSVVAAPSPSGEPTAIVNACTNPFPATGGGEAETDQQIVDRAPQAFRAAPLRVVLLSDYVAAAQSLPWVRQAGTTLRWTGSWLTAFTTADPAVGELTTAPQLAELADLLDRRRLAGSESCVLAPQYASVDLQVAVAADSTDFASDVAAAVLARLAPCTLPDGTPGFFDHSRWGFGQPLESAALLAAIQTAAGVIGVLEVLYRPAGTRAGWVPLPETLTLPADRILRVDNDPSRPQAGSVRVIVAGGK